MLPGTGPPTSIMCPNIELKPISSPSKNIGISTIQSLMWLNRAAALVGIALQDDVSRLELERLFGQHLGHVGAELPDDHPALRVGDHRELVVLLADDRGHRRSEQHRVHLVARVAQRVLDQIEGDRIE